MTTATQQHPVLDRVAEDVMTPGVVAVAADAPLRDALRAMSRHRVHAVVVLGADGEGPIGIVTPRAVMPFVARDAELVPVARAVVDPAVCVRPGAPLREVVAVFRETTTDHVLVARGPYERPDGIISALDVVALLA